MKMGNSQKQSISVQHRRWNRTSEPTKARNPASFEKWFLLGIRRQEKKGAEFTFLYPGLVRISWPGKIAILRTVTDLKKEYEGEYLSNF